MLRRRRIATDARAHPTPTTVDLIDMPISGQLLEVEGPMTRRVADLRTAFELLAGPTWRDPWTVPTPLRGPELAKPMRVALVVDPARQGIADQVKDGVVKAAAALADAGYVVEEIEPPSVDLAAKTALEMLTAELSVGIEYMTTYPSENKAVLNALIELAGYPDQARGMLAYMTRQSLLRAWGEFHEDHPLVVGPIFTDIPFAADTGYITQLELVTTVPASLRPANDAGAGANEFGAMSIPLPVWEPEAERRLDLIISRSRQAKAEQHPAAVMDLLAALSATPLGRCFAAHQHAINVEVTNVTGPPVPVHFLGARVFAVLPIVQLVGNMGPILCAFSYAGQLFLVVTAHAQSFPDLDLLMAGMQADASALLGATVAGQSRGRPALGPALGG